MKVVILAGGFGSRLSEYTDYIPKPMLKIGGKPILWHTIYAFSKVDIVEQIIISTSQNWIDQVEQLCLSIPNKKIKYQVILGGSKRQYSIQNGLNHLLDDIGMVGVHDAVRPFISTSLIIETTQMAIKFGGAIVGVPAKDTIKKVDHSKCIQDTPDRSNLWQAQTPQIFKKNLIINAYNSAINDNFIGTDDASLVERVGGKVKIVEGNRSNLKITYPVDLKIAEMILKQEKEV